MVQTLDAKHTFQNTPIQKQPESAKEKADSQKEFSVISGLKATVHNTQKNNTDIER
jgi:hypothetical protein